MSELGGPARGIRFGRGWARQRLGMGFRAGHPSQAKDPCSVPSMASTPPLWRGTNNRATGRPALLLLLLLLRCSGCPGPP